MTAQNNSSLKTQTNPLALLLAKPTADTETPSKHEIWKSRRSSGYADAEVTPRTVKTDPGKSARIIGRIEPNKSVPRSHLSPDELRSIRLEQETKIAWSENGRRKEQEATLAANKPVASAMPASHEEALSPEAEIVLKGRKNGRFVSLDERLKALAAADKTSKQRRPKKAKKPRRNAYLDFLARQKAETEKKVEDNSTD